ncbi:MAG TPA: ABC transporter substrate-binding protein [Bacilli bacterium]
MKAHGKFAIALLAFLITFSLVLAGCGGSDSGSSADGANNNQTANSANSDDASAAGQASGEGEGSGIDTSKPVQLTMYLLGAAPQGLPDVLKQVNEKLQKDINATLEINYIDWGNLQSKYPLLLASGEPIDLIYTADWNFYAQEAAKGAFMPLTQEMLQKYMPRHWKATSQDIWNGTMIDGKYFMIPTSSPDKKVQAALIRKDLREKYNVPEIHKFSELEPYFAALKKNNPEMIPLSMDSNTDLPMPFYNLLEEKTSYFNLATTNAAAVGVGYEQSDDSGQIYSQIDEPILSAEKWAAGIMKDWYDKGYVIKNPYANKVRSKDQFCEGKVGVALGNTQDLQSIMSQCQSKGIPTDIIPVWWPNGKEKLASPMNNGVAVPASSKNPERALMALDLIMEDPSYNYLVYFGVEGKNYVITDDGKIGLPPGVSAKDNDYPPDAAGFWFTNKNEFKPMADWTPQYIELQEQLKQNLVIPKYLTFSFNADNVKTQMANITNVSSQYMYPIYIGAVKNVDEAFNTVIDKLKAAGIEDVKAELQKQIDEFNVKQ